MRTTPSAVSSTSRRITNSNGLRVLRFIQRTGPPTGPVFLCPHGAPMRIFGERPRRSHHERLGLDPPGGVWRATVRRSGHQDESCPLIMVTNLTEGDVVVTGVVAGAPLHGGGGARSSRVLLSPAEAESRRSLPSARVLPSAGFVGWRVPGRLNRTSAARWCGSVFPYLG